MALKVLIVDEQAEAVKWYHEVLKPQGYRTQLIQSGKIALSTLQEADKARKPFQLAILQDGASIDGQRLIPEMHQKCPDLVILWLTDVRDVQTILNIVDPQTKIVLKPLTAEKLATLMKALEELVEKLEQVREQQRARVTIVPFIHETHLSLVLENNAEIIPLIIEYLLGFLEFNGVPEEVRFRVKLGLSETLINAMAHGNLEMSSAELKGDVKNFELWNRELEMRARQPKYRDRRVTVDVRYLPHEEVVILVQDQGEGFDVSKVMKKDEEAEETFNLFGRGLAMVRATCEKMEFNAKGNHVVLHYRPKASPN